MKIGLLVIATRKYKQFLDQFVQSAQQYFFPGDCEIHLFSENPYEGTVWHPTPSLGWPDATLCRYGIFRQHVEELLHLDYLFYCDVDMRFEAPIGSEIAHDLVAVMHPGFSIGQGAWETREESKAYVPPEKRRIYYAGGFNGGSTVTFLQMAFDLNQAIVEDSLNGITAEWHDESHLNRYLAEHEPWMLLPEYCWPEEYSGTGRITALLKDHEAMRA